VQDDEDDNDYDQNVNPIARTRKAWAYVLTEEAEQPQDYQNNNDSPQHIDFSFGRKYGRPPGRLAERPSA
jgi:hypothetical protein